MVKPIAMSASRGVIRADDPGALAAVIDRVRAIAADARDEEERSLLLVESFVPGPEVAVEGLLFDGQLEVLAIFDKPDPLDGPYFEESIYVTPSRLGKAAEKRITETVGRAAAAFGLVAGPVHAELRWHAGEAWLLEVAARTIGGECSRLLRFSAGHSLEEVVLAAAMGRRLPCGLASAASGVMMLPTPRAGTLRRVEGVLDALSVEGIDEVSISAGTGVELVPLPEGGAYLGYVFARGETPGGVEQALRTAAGRLRIVIAPMWRLEPGRLMRSVTRPSAAPVAGCSYFFPPNPRKPAGSPPKSPSPNRNPSMCCSITCWLSGSALVSWFSLMIICSRSSHWRHPSAETFS